MYKSAVSLTNDEIPMPVCLQCFIAHQQAKWTFSGLVNQMHWFIQNFLHFYHCWLLLFALCFFLDHPAFINIHCYRFIVNVSTCLTHLTVRLPVIPPSMISATMSFMATTIMIKRSGATLLTQQMMTQCMRMILRWRTSPDSCCVLNTKRSNA